MRSFEDKDVSKRDKRKQGTTMEDVLEAQHLLHEAYPDLKARIRVKDALWRAYTFLKPIVEARTKRVYTIRRVRATHEGTLRRVDNAEIEALRLAVLKEAMNEQTKLRSRLAELDARIATYHARKAEFQVAFQGTPVCGYGGRDSAGDVRPQG